MLPPLPPLPPLLALLAFGSLSLSAATLSWKNPVTGSWSDPANWDPAQAPAAADTVIIAVPGTYTVQVSGSVNVANLTLGGAGASPTLSFTSGSVSFTTAASVASGAVLEAGGGTLSGNLTIAAGGRLDFTGTGTKELGNLKLLNEGTIRWLGGTLDFTPAGTSARLTNAAVWEIHGNGLLRFPYGGTQPVLVNSGTVRKLTGTGITSLNNLVVHSAGTLQVDSGRLAIEGCNGTFAGTFAVAHDTVLAIGSSTLTNIAPATVTGPGTASFNTGTLWLGGSDQPAGLRLAGGTLRLLPAFQGGSITNLTLHGMDLAGSNRVTGSLVLNNSGASDELIIDPTGRLDLAGSSQKTFNNLRLLNNGTVRWLAGLLDFTPSGSNNRLTNAALWEIHADSTFRYGYGGDQPRFVNTGTLRKLDGPGTTTLNNLAFTQAGSIDIQKGRLDIQGCNGPLAGNTTVAPGASLTLSFSTFTNLAPATFTGPGSAAYTSGTLWLGGTDQPAGLALTGGTLRLLPTFQGGTITNLTLSGTDLSGSNRVTGTLVLTNSGISGELIIDPPGRLDLAGSSQKIFNNLRLLNNGTVRWLAGPLDFTPSGSNNRLTNAALWEIHADSSFRYGYGGDQPLFVNLGTLRKLNGTGNTTLNNLSVVNSGTLDIQKGRLDIQSCNGPLAGNTTVALGASLTFSSSTFTNLVPATFTGPGSAAYTSGTLWLGGADQPAGLALTGGTLRLLPAFQGGSITNLTLHGMDLAGSNRLTGSLVLTNSGLAGDLLIDPTGRLDLAGASQKIFNNLRLLNNGTVRWLAGLLDFSPSGSNNRLTNAALWEIHADSSFRYGYGGDQPLFINTGTLRKLNGPGTTTLNNLSIINSGTFDIQKGRLDIQSCNGPLAGNTTVALGASLTFSSSTFTNLTPATFTGPGSTAYTSGTLWLGGTDQPAGLALTGGTARTLPSFQGGSITNLTLHGMDLAGSNRLTGSLVLSNSGVSGHLTIEASGRLDIAGSSPKAFGDLQLLNLGTVRWLGGLLDFAPVGDRTRLTNAGLWELHPDTSFRYAYGGTQPHFVNQGLLRKTAGTGTTTLSGFNLLNPGIIESATGTLVLPDSFTNTTGTLRPTGGNLGGNNANTPITITGGVIEGSGGIRFANLLGGVISPGGEGLGDLLFSPSFILAPGVTVRVHVNGTTPGTQHDRIRVTGPVSLGNASLQVASATGIGFEQGAVLVDNDGADAVQGTFAGRAEGSLFDVSGRLYRLRYKSGTGNDTVLHRDDGAILLFPRRLGTNGLYRVAGLGTNFVTYAIQASTNLVDWTPIGTTPANGGGEFELEDPETPGFPHRYYRAIGP